MKLRVRVYTSYLRGPSTAMTATLGVVGVKASGSIHRSVDTVYFRPPFGFLGFSDFTDLAGKPGIQMEVVSAPRVVSEELQLATFEVLRWSFRSAAGYGSKGLWSLSGGATSDAQTNELSQPVIDGTAVPALVHDHIVGLLTP